ncbi:hypothetical protein [Streptomyces sp. NPDC055287]
MHGDEGPLTPGGCSSHRATSQRHRGGHRGRWRDRPELIVEVGVDVAATAPGGTPTDIPRFAQNHSGSEHYPFDLRIYGEVPEERARAARASDGQLPELLPLVD